MTKETVHAMYAEILKEELLPAMGCTEPIAVAYAAAIARKVLGRIPDKVEIRVSGNIVKNVKSVIVPNTGGLKGISAAAAAGIIAGNEGEKLEVIAAVTKEQIEEIKEYLATAEFEVVQSKEECIFDIAITVSADDHNAYARIAGYHTNVVCVKKDGEVVFEKEHNDENQTSRTDREVLNVKDIVQFAEEIDLEEVRECIERQITYNTQIAREGLEGDWGANIGSILLSSYGNGVFNRAKAMAAAGSDARMSGCELPVVINSGSGNQGMTASLPVIVYAEELGASKEELYRALIVSNLVTIHLKTGIGRLSAYCGATSAGCGAGAGITYLYGGRYKEIAHTVVNALAINSGVICDGAKASCAAKIASSVEAGLLGVQMCRNGSQFYGGDGIVVKGVENTIRNVGVLASEGMRETDKEIIRLMIEKI